jgi:TnpA family transposase
MRFLTASNIVVQPSESTALPSETGQAAPKKNPQTTPKTNSTSHPQSKKQTQIYPLITNLNESISFHHPCARWVSLDEHWWVNHRERRHISAINLRKQDLSALIESKLTDETRDILEELFVKTPAEDNTAEPSKTTRYKLTLLKKLSQSTKPTKVKESVDDLVYLSELHMRLTPILSAMNLNHEGIRYYAGSVIKSKIFQLNQRSDEDRYVHVTAFVAHQYYRLQDNLVDVLIGVVQSFQNSAQREHKEQIYGQRKAHNENLCGLFSRLDDDVFAVLKKIRKLTHDAKLNDTDKISKIRVLLKNGKDDELSSLKASLENELDEGGYFDFLEARSLRLQNRVSPILKALDFQAEPGAVELLNAINHFKAKDGTITQTAPLDFLDPQERKSVVGADDQKFRTSLYKAFLFMHTAIAIKSGNLNLEYSYKHRSLDNYMIGKDRWNREKDQLLERAGLTDFADSKKVLSELDEVLYKQYQTTNINAIKGENPHLKILANGQFRIATPALDEKESNPLQQFFPERHYVPLTEVLATVNQHCGFLEELQHWQQRHIRCHVSSRVLYAGVMGLGCGIGTRKMGQISSQVTENELVHAVNWYFSLDNILAANDRVVGVMNTMELPKAYQGTHDKLHTASDGQKFEVRTDSLNANYSFKYFGKGQGVSAYTFIDERNLLWHSLVFSAAERESAYVIDGLMRNDVVKSDIHSTDTHGYSEAIFSATYVLGFSYAPRIKNLKKQNLYIFKSRKNAVQSDWGITPDKYIAEYVIEENWDDFLRLITTIKLKETTASDIFRRLNSYSKQHSLYKAMKSFGQIIKSLFILRYIDELELRQAIEKQLNKVELANRLTRAVKVGNPREFTQAEKEDQEIAEACNRLIKNCIICWNYLYLSQKLARTETKEAKDHLMSAITTHSVVSWAHINLLGEYDFSDEKLQDSVGILPPKLAT